MKDTAHFEQVKKQNLRFIRNLLRETSWIGKTALASRSGLSFPTISALLKQLEADKEVISRENGLSSGGRPAAEYKLNPGFCTGACAYIENSWLHITLYDADMKPCQSMPDRLSISLNQDTTEQELISHFLDIKDTCPSLSDLSLGIPGVILDGNIQFLPIYPELEHRNLKQALEEALGIHIFIENDVNTMVLAERERWQNVIHIFMSDCCIGSGILIHGNLVHGAHGAAGELETLCGKIDKEPKELAKLIKTLQCVIDSPDIAISGNNFTQKHTELTTTCLKRILPKERRPNLHLVEDSTSLYEKGLRDMILERWKDR